MSGFPQDFALVPGQSAPEAPFVDVAGKTHSREALLSRASGLPLLLVFFKVNCPT